MSDPEIHSQHEGADRKATTLFATTALIAAITVGAMQVSGWHAGSLDDRVEVLFWAGAILGAVGIALLGAATFPRTRADAATLARIRSLTRAGLVLFLIAPALCVIAVFTNYWI